MTATATTAARAHRRSADAFGAVLAHVRDDQWTLPTPLSLIHI